MAFFSLFFYFYFQFVNYSLWARISTRNAVCLRYAGKLCQLCRETAFSRFEYLFYIFLFALFYIFFHWLLTFVNLHMTFAFAIGTFFYLFELVVGPGTTQLCLCFWWELRVWKKSTMEFLVTFIFVFFFQIHFSFHLNFRNKTYQYFELKKTNIRNHPSTQTQMHSITQFWHCMLSTNWPYIHQFINIFTQMTQLPITRIINCSWTCLAEACVMRS